MLKEFGTALVGMLREHYGSDN